MALQSVREVALHWGTFRNVDLFHTGFYRLRCRLFEETKDGGRINAVPHIVSPEKPSRQKLPGSLPASVMESEAAFYTHSFLICHTEEQVPLNEIVLYRFEQNAWKDPPLTLEVQLLFVDAPVTTSTTNSAGATPRAPPASIDATDGTGSIPASIGEADFSAVSTRRLHLHDVLTGVHAYSAFCFDEVHVCQVELMAHTTLLDFRLRIRPEVPLSPFAQLAPCDAPRRNSPATLADVLIDLAQQLPGAEAKRPERWAGGLLPKAATDGSNGKVARGGGLAEAVDRIQCESLTRLVAAHRSLTSLLSDLAKGQEGQPLHLGSLEAPRSTDVLVSPRLGDASAPTAAVTAARLLTEDIGFISAQVLQAWQLLLTTISRSSEAVTNLLRSVWSEFMVQHWAASIHCSTCEESMLAVEPDEEEAAAHMRAATALRRSPAFVGRPPHPLDDLAAVPAAEQPVLFEQRYAPSQEHSGDRRGAYVRGDVRRPDHCANGPDSNAGVHVVVLVHGFQGNAWDMRLLRNNIALLFPQALFMCSVANEEETEGDLELMGERLAAEVREFVQEWCTAGQPLARLSFITHSVGGVIARSALPLLTEYHSRMHTFLSFSSPHLGYLYSPNSLFKAGLWAVTKLKKSKCLEQLSMTDSADPGSCYLVRLAEIPGLEHFQHVVLVSSQQDSYAPFPSARIEMSRAAEADPELGAGCAKMLRSVLEPLEAKRVIRIDVNFHIPETTVDSLIGRFAHIQFIECQALMRALVHTHAFLFE